MSPEFNPDAEREWLVYESKCGRGDVVEHVYDQLDSGHSGRSIYYK